MIFTYKPVKAIYVSWDSLPIGVEFLIEEITIDWSKGVGLFGGTRKYNKIKRAVVGIILQHTENRNYGYPKESRALALIPPIRIVSEI